MSTIRQKVAWDSKALPPMITQLYALGLRVPPHAQVRDDGGGVVAVEGRAKVAPGLGKGGLQWRLAKAPLSCRQAKKDNQSFVFVRHKHII